MVKRITLFILAFAVAAAVIFTGCAPARKPYNEGQGNNANMNSNNGDIRGIRPDDETGLGNNYNNYTNGTTGMYNTGLNDGRVGNNLGNFNGNNPAGYNGNTIGYNNDNSNALARACEQVQGVENATVVVAGNTAYVGIDMDENTNIASERDIKNEVAQKVRAADNKVNTVYVSAEMDFMDRLRNVGNGLRNGRPVDAFTTELNEMVQRLNPARW